MSETTVAALYVEKGDSAAEDRVCTVCGARTEVWRGCPACGAETVAASGHLDESCTRCGATPETGLNDDCPECRGLVESIQAEFDALD